MGSDRVKVTSNPWNHDVLPRKTVELIGLAVNAACTNLNPEGTRRHIRAALEAGASREEILMVLKMRGLMSIHSCSLGAPILLEEAKAADVRRREAAAARQPATRCGRSASGTRRGLRSTTSIRCGPMSSWRRDSHL